MKTYKDVQSEVDNDGGWISLEKVVGKKIKEVQGYLSSEFGDPVFQLFRIYFEDGSSCFVEGEHDMPYLSGLDVSDEEIEAIYKSNPDYDPSEDEDE